MTEDLPEHLLMKPRIDGELRTFVDEEVALLLDIDAALAPLADGLRKVTAEGERLRGAFWHWGWRAAGQPDSGEMVMVAAAVELVHAAALVHDDIIDDSPVRHGRTTAHIALQAPSPPPPPAPTAGSPRRCPPKSPRGD